MSNKSTCKLTEEKAKAIAELWIEGLSFRSIVENLRARDLLVWPADISNWCESNREVEIDGELRGFNDYMKAFWPSRKMNLINEAIELVDEGAEAGVDARILRVRANVRFHAIRAMEPKHVQAPTPPGNGFILPYNPLFQASEDAEPN